MSGGKVSEKHIRWVQEAVDSNPHDFQARMSLITVLKEAGESERLEKARNDFADEFPLTEDIWLDWLKELPERLRADPSPYADYLQLFQRATRDCGFSVSIWKTFLEVMQFCSVALEEPVPFEYVRNLFEQAIYHVGHHVKRGHEIWLLYLEWEDELHTAMAESMQDEKEVQTQENVVRTLYARALKAPLAHLEDVWKSYDEWEEDLNKKAGLQKKKEAGAAAYASRVSKEEKIVGLTDSLQKQNLELFRAVMDYLNFEEHQLTAKKEKGKRDISSSIALFERALQAFSEIPDLWLRYFSFICKWRDEESWSVLAERALRHCRWSGAVQSMCGRLLFASLEDKAVSRNALDRALVGGLSSADDFHAVYCAIEELFPDAGVLDTHMETLATYFPNRPDLKSELLEVKAMKALESGDEEGFFNLWDEALKAYGSQSWSSWSRFLAACPSTDVAKVRSLYKRAVNSINDAPESASYAWKLWERVHGDPAALLDCSCVIERRLRTVNNQRLKAQQQEEKRALKQAQAAAAATGTTSSGSGNVSSVNESGSVTGGASIFTSTSAMVANVDEKKNRTICVKNLLFEFSEAKVKELFEPFGTVVEVRLAKDPAGSSRGFGFVEFETESACTAALALDNKEVMGRPLSVSRSVLGAQESGVAPMHTLFLRNLPFDVTEDEIKGALSQVAVTNPIRAIRLMKDSEGKLKGSAFVDFSKIVALEVLKLDNLIKLKGRTLRIEFAKSKGKPKGLRDPAAATTTTDKADSVAGEAQEPVLKRVKVVEEEQEHVAYDDSKTLFIGNVPTEATEDQIRAAFPKVAQVRLQKSKDGGHRGRGYLEFHDEASRSEALEMNGKASVAGQVVTIAEPKPREKGKSLKIAAATEALQARAVSSLVPPSIARRMNKK